MALPTITRLPEKARLSRNRIEDSTHLHEPLDRSAAENGYAQANSIDAQANTIDRDVGHRSGFLAGSRRTLRGLPGDLMFRTLLMVSAGLVGLTGCQDDSDLVRQIQRDRQIRQQSGTQQDHLGEVFALLDQYVDLDPGRANRQMAFHLNSWSQTRDPADAKPPELMRSLRDLDPDGKLVSRVANETFQPSDAVHLRDSFLFNALSSWVDTPANDEALLAEWFTENRERFGREGTETLLTATRLFDWTVRHIALEPDQVNASAPPPPDFPLGMQFRGPGYRQTDYQTLMRGTGDGLQRAGVFTQLCRQADVPAALIGTIDSETGAVTPFFVGVLAAGDIYLFEPRLGIFVPGPGQQGIATLSQARTDALVLRRLGIAGFDQFTYPIGKEDVQQCVALFNLLPEAVSPRMQQLQAGLTGTRRMNVFVDADRLAKQFDDVTGIAGARMWKVPLLAEVYRQVSEQHAERDPVFSFWYKARWAMLEGEVDTAEDLLRGRWRHMIGMFADDEEENEKGARTLYLEQRAPEFEIEDLRIDVELQKAYGIRRELGMDPQVYDQQLRQIQAMLRMGKRTATYWLSLLQADDGRIETAENWISKRVLDEEQESYWVPAARYNLARLAETLGEPERAIELYKRDGEPQEHGNRIRARLLAKQEDL
jgi:hypothetical protein